MTDSHNSMLTCRRLVRSPLSLILSVFVLVSRECSAFLPTPATARSCWPPPFGEYTCVGAGMKRPASTARGTSLLFGTAASDGSTVISSSYAQKVLAELEASGRVMTKRDQKWWARFEELEEYKREHGDCNVPRSYKANPQLGTWVHTQRRSYKNSNLSSERVEALESLGFEWIRAGREIDDANWWKRLGELEEYKEEHGDCNVPINYQANPQLGTWVMRQRAYYHRFFDENWKLSPGITKERIDALNEIEFEWRLRDRPERDERYDELVAYKERHGDTLVPMDQRRGSGNRYYDLALWVHTQRKQYRLLQKGKHSQLTDERIEKLNRIGFVWDVQEAAWEDNFAELLEFKSIHGHTDVPSFWENESLVNWTKAQKRFYKELKEGRKTYITKERIERLDGIGFEWRSKNTYNWKIRLGELRGFYDENCVIPIPRAEHPTLFTWALAQKKDYDKYVRGEKTNMDEERINDLERIGFFEVFGN